MTYDANKLMAILGAMLSTITTLGIVVMALYVMYYDKRDPEVCLKAGGTVTIVEGKTMCNVEK